MSHLTVYEVLINRHIPGLSAIHYADKENPPQQTLGRVRKSIKVTS